jgi:hypothetical protein
MNYNPNIVGHGYNQAVLRVERRPTQVPHTKDELLEILDILADCGVEAWWYSVSAKGSYPLFPSKVLPYKKDVAVDYYPWLVEEAHKRDIVLYSWEYLNTAPLLMQEHPDWRVKYLAGPELVTTETERHGHFACLRSPYGELLKDFCVEVVNDIGFDGIWFDGCYQFGPAEDGFRWTCCCERCTKAFKDETGLDLPKKIDWNDPAFPTYLQWRYRFFENYWESLANHVRSRNKTALVAFNFFNRHYMGTVSGSPLHRHKMDALVAGEGTVLTLQMQTKILRAISDKYPPEVWTALHDGVKLSYPFRPNPDPISAIFYAQTAATAGGFASFGLPAPKDCRETLKAMADALKPIKPYIGGNPVKLCGLVFSGANKDFANPNLPGARQNAGKHKPAVDNAYGMGFLLNDLHYPFEIVLDNQLDATLKQYKIIVLPDVQCMSDEAAIQLENYVQNGGILIACGECGTKTLDGSPRTTGVLDKLLGIKTRHDTLDYCILEPETEILRQGILPDRYMISGKARLVETNNEATVLAKGRGMPPKAQTANHDKQTETQPGTATTVSATPIPIDHEKTTGVAISERNVNGGRAIFVAPAIGLDYSQNPNRRSREVIKQLTGQVDLPFTTDAPAGVVVTAWQKDGNLIFHLLNQPATMRRMLGYSSALNPEDVTPTGPITIHFPGNAASVFSPVPETNVTYENADKHVIIQVSRLEQHAVVVVVPQPNSVETP